MTEIYKVVKNTIYKIFETLYSAMNDYLENILNAPSTINRIITQYEIGFNNDEPLEGYIVFNRIIVMVFKIELEGL